MHRQYISRIRTIFTIFVVRVTGDLTAEYERWHVSRRVPERKVTTLPYMVILRLSRIFRI